MFLLITVIIVGGKLLRGHTHTCLTIKKKKMTSLCFNTVVKSGVGLRRNVTCAV